MKAGDTVIFNNKGLLSTIPQQIIQIMEGEEVLLVEQNEDDGEDKDTYNIDYDFYGGRITLYTVPSECLQEI